MLSLSTRRAGEWPARAECRRAAARETPSGRWGRFRRVRRRRRVGCRGEVRSVAVRWLRATPFRERVQTLLETSRLRLVAGERAAQARIGIGVDVSALLPRAVDCVSQCLRSLVGELPRAQGIEARLPFIEGTLRRLSRAIQLLFDLVPEWHGRHLPCVNGDRAG